MTYLTFEGSGPVIQVNFGYKNNPVGKFVREVDGYYYFLHDGWNGGIIPGYVLRELADKLDELNRPMDDHIGKYHTHNDE